jgi:outer membrane protein
MGLTVSTKTVDITMPLRLLLIVLLGVAAAKAAATEPAAPQWSAELGMLLSDSPYAGEGQRLRAFPLIGWQGERFYLGGLDLGWQVVRRPNMQLDAALSARLDGFEAADLGRAELAANGIDRELLDDRSDGVDATLTLRWPVRRLQFEAQFRQDVSAASKGADLRVRAQHTLSAGAWRWSPYLQLSWMSTDLAAYYFGISRREAQRGLPEYRPGSVWQPELGLGLNRSFRSEWFLLGNLRYSRLPDALADSPLLQDDAEAGLFLALGKGF